MAALAAQAEAHAQEKTVEDTERARLATERQAYDEWASRVIAEAVRLIRFGGRFNYAA